MEFVSGPASCHEGPGQWENPKDTDLSPEST